MTSDQFVIRPFKPEDLLAINQWFADPQLSRFLGPLDEEWLDAVEAESETSPTLVIVSPSGELAGLFELCLPVEDHLQLAITSIAVKPQSKRQGIGARIVEWVVQFARQSNVETVACFVDIENTVAQQFFLGLQFVQTGVKDKMHTFELKVAP